MVALISASAPGKINLHFSVGSLRPDGYHEVVSVYQAFDLRDYVSGELSNSFSIKVSGSLAEDQLSLVPKDDSNLVVRAAKAVADAAGVAPLPISFTIDKHIPVAGGLAGGSADAAAAMLVAASLYGVDVDLAAIAVKIGADVTFALTGGTALGTGVGENLSPIESAESWYLIIPSETGISTPAAFAILDQNREAAGLDKTAISVVSPDSDFLERLAAGAYREITPKNDLAAVAISQLPSLQGLLDLGAWVSGSGPSTFMVFESEQQAQQRSKSLLERGIRNVVAKGNAEGARMENI